MAKTPPKNPRKTHSIPQPLLRPLQGNERYVKTAGLVFILPNVASEGDVLSKRMADFLNVAYHTAILNRFSVIRKALLESPYVTYEDLDEELRALFSTISLSTRPNKPPVVSSTESQEDEEELQLLITWSRPTFRKIIQTGGYKLERKEYEAALRKWVLENRDHLQNLFNQELADQEAFIEEFAFLTSETL